MTTITPLPTPVPSRTQDAATFVSASDALLGALPNFVTQTNLVAGEVNTAASVASTASTIASAAQATIVATASATLWVSGTSYTKGTAVFSLLNFLTYRKTTPNSVTSIDPALDTVNWQQVVPTSLKNLVINADMAVCQEFIGAGVTQAANGAVVYPVDQWLTVNTRTNGTTLVGQQVFSPLPGYRMALRLTNTTTGTSVASDAISVSQPIEGTRLAGLGWGTSSAQPITISFVAVSTVTGNYCVSLRNAASATRSYCHLFALVANIPTRVSFVVPGDTTGTWSTAASLGLLLTFDLGSGSTFQTATLDAWQNGNFVAATTGTKLSATAGAQFTLTGVYTQVGSQATLFEPKPIEEEIVACQRYYRKTFAQATAVANNAGQGGALFVGGNGISAYHFARWEHGVMRSIPSYTAYNPMSTNGGVWREAGGTETVAGTLAQGDTSCIVTLNNNSLFTPAAGSAWYVHITANARML
jgi:hypothetical protein